MTWQQAKWLILPAVAIGCAGTAPTASSGGFAIAFAAVSSESGQTCSPTWNGTGTLPAGDQPVDHLTLQWTNTETSKSGTARVSAADVAGNGIWNVGAVPVTQALQLQVYACTADNRVVSYGKGADFAIADGGETTARVFMVPPGKLACTGSGGVGGMPQSARAFAGGTALASGDAIVVGGADKWEGGLAKASVATDIYDYRLGQWRAGPTMRAPRLQPQVLPLDRTHVLVAGGAARLKDVQPLLPVTLFAPDDLSAAGEAKPAAEVIDIEAMPPVSAEVSTAIGTGARPLSAAAVAGDAVVFVGGMDPLGVGLATGTRVRGLAAIATGAGTSEALKLKAARIQPNVLAYADGTVVVWGGQTSAKAADFGEIIAPGDTEGVALIGSGDPVILDPDAPAIGAAAVVLTEDKDTLTFFVTGGIPVGAIWATATPSYIVVVNRADHTAACKKVLLSDNSTLPGGVGVALTRLDGGFLLVSGGLLSLGKVTALADDKGLRCQDDPQFANGCLVRGLVLLDPPVDLSGVQVTLKSQTLDMGPHVGQIALPLPVGALLTGGLVGLPASITEPFDPAAQLLSAPFADAVSQAACKL